jgi:very-short-patch-repair endonuclease
MIHLRPSLRNHFDAHGAQMARQTRAQDRHERTLALTKAALKNGISEDEYYQRAALIEEERERDDPWISARDAGQEYVRLASECSAKIDDPISVESPAEFALYQTLNHAFLFVDGVETAIKLQHPAGRCRLDFAIIGNGKKLNIEVDGAAYHTDQAKDLRRDSWLRSQGWVVIRYKAKDLLTSRDYCQSAADDIRDVYLGKVTPEFLLGFSGHFEAHALEQHPEIFLPRGECVDCRGAGVFERGDAWTGFDPVECESCNGSGAEPAHHKRDHPGWWEARYSGHFW